MQKKRAKSKNLAIYGHFSLRFSSKAVDYRRIPESFCALT